MVGDGQQKPVVLFIHGFGSSSKCWNSLLALLRKDQRVAARYDFKTWDYPTKWIEVNLTRRIPRLEEIARALRDLLDSSEYRRREVTLVGHSQGGLVIQAYLAFVLGDAKGEKLRNLRQVIFLATPSAGSTTAISLRVFMASLFHNPQEITLRVLNPEVGDMRNRVRERIVAATRDSDKEWRVPIHAFCGMEDNIVVEDSARGVFDNVKSVPGTHFSILTPKDAEDDRYKAFVELLLDPGGHKHLFEVERFENIIKIEPRIPPAMVATKRRNRPCEMQYDNFATLTRRVRFAAANRCRDPFSINYATRERGYVEGHPSHPNQVCAADRGQNEETGQAHKFVFTPNETEEEYGVTVDIYNGYPPNERNVHFHPGTHNSRLRLLSYELDLSAYLKAGFVFKQKPTCYVLPRDVDHGELCRLRQGSQLLPPISETSEGVYRWELRDVRHGVVDLVWDFEEPTAADV